MTYSYSPYPSYASYASEAAPVATPRYRLTAQVAWVVMGIWNSLVTLGYLLATIGTIIGAGVLATAVRDQETAAPDPHSQVSMAGSAGAVVLVIALVLGVIFLISLVLTVLTWRRVWAVLLVQAIASTLAAGMMLFQAAAHHDTPAAYLVIMFGSWAVGLLCTILTAPGLDRHKPEPVTYR